MPSARPKNAKYLFLLNSVWGGEGGEAAWEPSSRNNFHVPLHNDVTLDLHWCDREHGLANKTNKWHTGL